jgi:hypothetical protein
MNELGGCGIFTRVTTAAGAAGAHRNSYAQIQSGVVQALVARLALTQLQLTV